MTSVQLRRNDEPPARAQQPRRLRDPAVRVDPESTRRTRRRRGRSSRPGRPVVAGVGLDERELDPRLRLHAARRVELRRRDVDADRPGAAPREPGGEVRGAAAELDDVEAGDVTEHVQLRLGDAPDAPRDLVDRPVRRGALVRVLARSLRSRRGGCVGVAAPGSDEPIGEPERDLALGRLGRVRPVDEVVRHRERELAAQRAGVGVGRIGRADRLAAVAIAPSPSSTNASVGPEVMKSTSSPKNGFSRVLGVVRLAELADAATSRAARSFSPRRSKRATISPARLRSTASGFARISVRSTAMRPRDYRVWRRLRGWPLGASPIATRHVLVVRRSASRSTGRPATPARAACRSSCTPGAASSCRPGRRGTPRSTSRAADRAAQVAGAEPLLHRLDLELALAHVLEVLRRPEEHVDQRPDERRRSPDRGRRPRRAACRRCAGGRP